MLKEFTTLFLKHTLPTRKHLAPELILRLVTPECPLWRAPAEHSPFSDPYWGFFWPGGQATCRYILDHQEVVRSRRVLDVGCGCGAAAVAAVLAGAADVLANDIDPYAIEATKINAKLNNVTKLKTTEKNYIGTECKEFDVILIGDMFYDEHFGKVLFEWLYKLAYDKTIIIGDPGRHGLSRSKQAFMTLLAKYNLPKESCMENNGFVDVKVWKLNNI